MFLVLMRNGDPFCGGDYEFCKNEKELKELMSYSYVYHIYKLVGNELDYIQYYLDKFKNSYNNHYDSKRFTL